MPEQQDEELKDGEKPRQKLGFFGYVTEVLDRLKE